MAMGADAQFAFVQVALEDTPAVATIGQLHAVFGGQREPLAGDGVAVFEAAVRDVFWRAAGEARPFAFEPGGVEAGFFDVAPEVFAVAG